MLAVTSVPFVGGSGGIEAAVVAAGAAAAAGRHGRGAAAVLGFRKHGGRTGNPGTSPSMERENAAN